MSEVPKCTSWLGHSFEPRYSTATPRNAADIVAAMKADQTRGTVEFEIKQDRVYHHDICVRCGFVVERRTPQTSTETIA